MIDNFADRVRSQPAAMESAGLVGPMWEDGVDGVIGSLPSIEGKSLGDSLDACAEFLGHPEVVVRPAGWTSNRGGPLHNLIHALGRSSS
jgi:hypothetical protein